MFEGRKQAVSLRVTVRDLRNLKKLSRRLGVRDSEVIRFALKTMLSRLAPLCDEGVRGRDLLPLFIEAGSDLFRHFDLDAERLAEIVNEGVPEGEAVACDALQRIATDGIEQAYAKLRVDRALSSGLLTEQVQLRHRGHGLPNGHTSGSGYPRHVDSKPSNDTAGK